MTKLKPQDRRVPFNRMVHPRTVKAVKRIAKRKGISEGKVIDAAVERLAGPILNLPAHPKRYAKLLKMNPTNDEISIAYAYQLVGANANSESVYDAVCRLRSAKQLKEREVKTKVAK